MSGELSLLARPTVSVGTLFIRRNGALRRVVVARRDRRRAWSAVRRMARLGWRPAAIAHALHLRRSRIAAILAVRTGLDGLLRSDFRRAA